MDKVLQILVVTGLLMLLIWRSIRGREERFRRFSYLVRVRPPLAAEVTRRLVRGVFEPKAKASEPKAKDAIEGSTVLTPKVNEGRAGGAGRSSERSEDHGAGGEAYGMPMDADAFLLDEDSRMVLLYWLDGKLTISLRMAGGRNKELQELAVPMDCTGLGWDPQERKIYLEEDGDWFVYAEEG